MRKFWRTKQVEPDPEPDVITRPPLFFEVDPSIREQIEKLDTDRTGNTVAVGIFTKYVKSLNIVQLLCVYGDPWFEEQNERFGHNLSSVYYDEEWKRRWPLGEDNYDENIPEIVRGALPFKNVPKDDIDLKALLKKVDGMQKRIDAMDKVLNNVDVTLSAKQAVDLAKC